MKTLNNILKIMKYIAIEWPEIQDYMSRRDFKENSYFDPTKNVWLIPEAWLDPYADLSDEELKEEFEYWCGGDLDDAMG